MPRATVLTGFVDQFPLGAVVNKGLTPRGAQMHGQRYIPLLLDRIARGELQASYLGTPVRSLDDAPAGYEMFEHTRDGCLRAVLRPDDQEPA